MSYGFATPIAFALLAIIPLLIFWLVRYSRRRTSSILFPDFRLITKTSPAGRIWAEFVSPGLRILALVLLIVALARPQESSVNVESETEGIDIILTLDISGSMKAEDFKPQNRLYVAKQVIKEFIAGRTSDRIGLVVFAKESFTQCPLTLDYNILLKFLDEVTFGMVEDGTAIGMAIANSCNRLRNSPAKNKVIVLLTDGVNNAGEINPVTAAEIAKTLGIRIYAVGAGKPGPAPYPVDDPIFGRRYVNIENEIDEASLRQIADLTGGKYYRAMDEKGLKQIYDEISSLERTKIKTKQYVQYRELYLYFLVAGLGLILVEVVLSQTRFRKIP
ncbi:MAG: VWA domain-containing protein [candidate division Zixibacteria bacterium]|nr:VWA domain-containing protein [candidate division Zixibacteria bacterium]MBU1469169.1 VWA domain-containing protein [candidate division Zixibacteria bacterium]MBU2625343.1 VWA domain-containing protein [candidate division Zixibacteria bacterium]